MSFWRATGSTRILAIMIVAVVFIVAAFAALLFLPFGKTTYSSQLDIVASTTVTAATIDAATSSIQAFVVTHTKTPKPLKAVYMSSWAAGNKNFRKELFDLVETTEINAVVIDVKDYTGHISFPVTDPELQKTGAAEDRIPDIKEFIGELHAKGVYVIGRISSFQDSYLINIHPEWAVKTKEGNVWADYHGVKWLDAGAKPVWDYLIAIGNEAYNDGFDELNFDYIRYPSDGNLKDIAYSWSDGRPREVVMRSFFEYLHDYFSPKNIPISADLFGLTTSATDDLGIGQVLLDALPNFDYVAPMVYPSHFATGYLGFTKPAQHPYDVIHFAMNRAVVRAEASSTDPDKLRPWLQAFDLGAIYTPAMVRAEMQAAYDIGLHSWMLWNAGSVYKKDALEDKGIVDQVAEFAPLKVASSTPQLVASSTTL